METTDGGYPKLCKSGILFINYLKMFLKLKYEILPKIMIAKALIIAKASANVNQIMQEIHIVKDFLVIELIIEVYINNFGKIYKTQ